MIEKKKKGKKGFLFLILGTLAAFLGTGLYILLAGWISSLVIEGSLGGQTAYALLTASVPCMCIVFLLLDGVLIVNYLPSSPTPDEKEHQPMLGHRTDRGISPRAIRIVSIALVAAIIPVTLVSVGTYRSVSEEGVSSSFCFITTEEYRWEQVVSYEMDCDNNSKGLSITFTMRDGHTVEILQGTFSAPASFKSAYECKEAFALEIVQKMEELQIPCRTFESQSEHSKLKEASRGFYKNNEALWPYIQQLIRYQAIPAE